MGGNPKSIVIGDINSDGKLDLATANKGSKEASILLGEGLGLFRTATNFSL